MEWKNINNPPNSDEEILLQINVIDNIFKGDMYTDICIGSYFNGEYEARLPVIFDYPANYFEGTYEVTHWMKLPPKAIE